MSLDLRSYRPVIADMKAVCERTLGQRFQALDILKLLAVLAQIERPPDTARDVRSYLLGGLLNYASKAYFEVAASSRTEVAEARCSVST